MSTNRSMYLDPVWRSVVAPALETIEKLPAPSPANAFYANTRNIVREIPCPGSPNPLLLKQQCINPDYPLNRRISFYLRNLFKHYGRRGFRGSKLLIAAGIPTPPPIAYWKSRRGFLRYESCYLYEKMPAYGNVRDFLLSEQLQNHPSRRAVIKEMGRLARRMHDEGVLHGDLVANNILLKSVPEAGELPELFLIDTDHTKKNLLPLKLGGRALALRCFRRWHFQAEEADVFLRAYFDGSYSPLWRRVISFWSWLDRRPLRHLRRLIPGYQVYQKASSKGTLTAPTQNQASPSER